jgi:hypothetical protein
VELTETPSVLCTASALTFLQAAKSASRAAIPPDSYTWSYWPEEHPAANTRKASKTFARRCLTGRAGEGCLREIGLLENELQGEL